MSRVSRDTLGHRNGPVHAATAFLEGLEDKGLAREIAWIPIGR